MDKFCIDACRWPILLYSPSQEIIPKLVRLSAKSKKHSHLPDNIATNTRLDYFTDSLLQNKTGCSVGLIYGAPIQSS